MKKILLLSSAILMAAPALAHMPLGQMHRDTIAFQIKLHDAGGVYQTRDDAAPSYAEIKANQDKLMSALEAMREKDDQRLDGIEKRLSEDVVDREQVDRIKQDVIDLKSVRDDLDKLAKRMSRPGGDGTGTDVESVEAIEHRDAFLNFMRSPDDAQAKSDLQETHKRAMAAKAVVTTTDASGGYAVPQMIERVVQRELSEVGGLASLVHTVKAGTKEYKELVDTRGLTYGWVGEGDTRGETGTPGIDESVPTFGTLYAYPKASEESLDDIYFDVGAWLIDGISEGFAEGRENMIVSGNGTKKGTGFLNGTPTAEVDGTRAFGTLQYKAGGHASLINSADPLITLSKSLKKGYRNNALWLMNKLTSADVMTLKDGDGNYLWKMGDIQSGQPDRLLGYGVEECEEMPDVAADAFPISFGDYKAGYLMVELVGLKITRDEITTPGYIKWYARRRIGGNVRKSEAIKLLKIATS